MLGGSDNFEVFVSCSPRYVHVRVLHGVLLVPTTILYPLTDLHSISSHSLAGVVLGSVSIFTGDVDMAKDTSL